MTLRSVRVRVRVRGSSERKQKQGMHTLALCLCCGCDTGAQFDYLEFILLTNGKVDPLLGDDTHTRTHTHTGGKHAISPFLFTERTGASSVPPCCCLQKETPHYWPCTLKYFLWPRPPPPSLARFLSSAPAGFLAAGPCCCCCCCCWSTE